MTDTGPAGARIRILEGRTPKAWGDDQCAVGIRDVPCARAGGIEGDGGAGGGGIRLVVVTGTGAGVQKWHRSGAACGPP